MMRYGIFAGVSVLILGVVLPAATLERLSLEEMSLKSSAIARVRVLDSYAAAYGSNIYTHYRVEVSERWKGPDQTELDVVVLGGVAGGVRQSFSGAPKLTAGREYLLFLWKSPSGLTHIIGFSQGVFDIQRGQTGETMAVRAAASEQMLDSSGRPVRDRAVNLKLSELRQRVSRSLAAGELR
jgi:hypothetical protein